MLKRVSPKTLVLPPAGGDGLGGEAARAADVKVMLASTHDELRQHQHGEHQRDPPLLAVGLLLLLEGAQVEQHDDEDEEHHDGARVDQDLHHGQEVGLGEEEDGGHVEEREHQQQQRVDDVLAGDGADAAGHGEDPEDDEEHLGDRHGSIPLLFDATLPMMRLPSAMPAGSAPGSSVWRPRAPRRRAAAGGRLGLVESILRDRTIAVNCALRAPDGSIRSASVTRGRLPCARTPGWRATSPC